MNPNSHSKRAFRWVLFCLASILAAATAFGQSSFRNQGGTITINDNSKATPYPSTNFVSGLTGVVEKVTITLNGVNHGYPDDIDMILQAPDGTKTMIMSDAGGQFDLIGSTFTLDSTAGSPLPNEGQINSGSSYKPANYDGGGADVDNFPAGSSTGGPSLAAGSQSGLSADLTVFNALNATDSGHTPNGTWNLYVVDDNVVDNGSISSWTLNLYMTPVLTITNSSPVAVTEDIPATINVFVNDSDTPLQNVTLTATSSDTSIIPNSGLTFGGNTGGSTRTLTISPKANANGGPVTITVKAKDAQGAEVSGVNVQTFTVNVGPVNDAPAIVNVAGTTSISIPQAGVTAPISLQVTDVDDPATDVVLTAFSSNPAVIPATNVLFTRIASPSGGTAGTNRTVQIASGAATGSATIWVIATDPHGAATSNSITATVTAGAGIIGANTTSIVVPDNGTATPYPSQITIPNATGLGLVGKAVVNLIDVEHANPSDLGVLLVSPSGRAVVLMRGAGDSNPVGLGDTNDVRITFDRDASASVSGTTLTTSTNRTTDMGTAAGTDFPASAPTSASSTYSTDIGSLEGSAINGVWSLYVYDSANNSIGGQIAGGWTLQIFSAPTIGAIADQTTPEDTSKTITFQVGDISGSVTNIGASVVNPADAGKVTLTTTLSGGTAALKITPAPDFNTGIPGSDTPVQIQVVVTNNTAGSVASAGFTATNKFLLHVTPVNDVPTQSVIPKQITRAGQSVGPISFTVGDKPGETAPANLVVTVTSDNPKLLPPGAIIVGTDPNDVTGATRTIQIFPAGAQGGTANITVTVTDTGDGFNGPASSSQTFDLTVNPAASPLYENTGGIAINDNAAAAPYPSKISVSGLQGTVAEVQVTLFGITHPNPDDLDIMLVGPGTSPKGVIIMSDAGDSGDGSKPLNNVTLRFRDSATGVNPNTGLGPVPDEAQIVSGDYQPANYGGGDFGFTGDPVATDTALSGFNGIIPNGDWSLYVRDDTASVRGGIISSWQLNIRTHPVFAAIPDQTVTEHNTLRVTANLGDDQPGVPYTVTTSHSAAQGTDVIASVTPSSGTVFGGSQTFTITLIPEIGSSKQTNQVTINVTDPDGVTVSRTFNVVVVPVDDAPVFGAIADKTTPVATPVDVTFTVSDPEGTAVGISATSSDQNVVADTGITPNPMSATTASSRTITITPNGINSGSTIITLVATDATGQKSTKTFKLTVSPNVSFANRSPITINDFAPASPYPSTIDVAGVNGTVSGASVILVGLTHPFPGDVDVLLVAPDGRSVMLMSDAGTNLGVSDVRLTFADGGTPIPQFTQISTGTYAPANYPQNGGEVDEMPSPAPAGSYSTALSSLQGVNPNGQWKLYVRDDTFPDGGQISGGWILLLQTAPTITQISTQTTPEDTVLQVPFTVSDQDTPVTGLTITTSVTGAGGTGANQFSDPGLIPATKTQPGITWVTNSSNPPTVQYTLNILPSTNWPNRVNGGTTPATNAVTVTVTDSNGNTASTTFLVRVTPVDDAPQVAGPFLAHGTAGNADFDYATNRVITAQTRTSPAESHPITVTFNLNDVDSTMGTSTNIVVQSQNPGLLPNKAANIAISGPNDVGTNTDFTVNVTLTPAENQSGSALVYFIASDRNTTVTNQFTLVVNPANNLPTIAFPGMNATTPVTNVIAGGTLINIPVTISDFETAPENLILTATSRTQDQGLVPNSGIVLGGRGSNRTLTLSTVGTATGDAVITVVVEDAAGDKTSRSFTVHVTPPPGSVFSNGGAITIPDSANGNSGPAAPYPSVLSVSGMIGSISKITVTVDGLAHTAPDDIDMLLVSPTGKKAILMSDAGGRNAISGVRLVFDANGSVLPDDGQIASGTYSPADYEPGVDSFPSTAPAGPYVASLGEFLGTNPNGTWSLFVVDDATGDVGQIAFGWSLRIETAPTLTLNSGLNTPSGTPTYVQFAEDSTTVLGFTINDMTTRPEDLAVSFTSSNPGLISSITTNWTALNGNAATIDATIHPVTNAFGTNNLTIVVRRSDGAQSSIVVPMNITPLNDLPAISRLVDRSTSADTPLSVPVLITDVDTPLNRIWVIASSGTPSVISSTNILIAGKTNELHGLVANDTSLSAFPPGNLDSWINSITVVPNTAAFSTTPVPITIEVREVDANGVTVQSVSSTFGVTVNAVNHAPTITGANGNSIPPLIAVEAGQSTTNIVFTVGDADNDPVTVTATSDNQALVSDAGISIYNGTDTTTPINGASVSPGAVGSNGGNRTIKVETQPGVQGDAVITLTVKDQHNAKAATQFTIRVVPTRELVFSNNRPMVIRDNNAADVYPSQINVSGFAGVVSKVTVTLSGFWHTFPDDVDMILVSPTGKKSYLMSDAGGGNAVTAGNAINIHFDDTESTLIPDNTQITGRTYHIANYEGNGTDDFVNRSPAGPAGPYADQSSTPAGLAAFNGDSPNGVWSLYVVDDTPSDSGAITNGWSIGITTLPVLVGLGDVVSKEDNAITIPFTIAEESFVNTANYSFTASSSNPALVPNGNIVVTGTGTNRVVTITPVANANNVTAGGTAQITLTEQTTGVTSKFTVSFTPVNDAPVITQVADVTMPQGSFTIVPNFNYSDVETPKKDLTTNIVSSDTRVIPTQNVVISGNELHIFSGTQPGTSQITITVADNGDGTNPGTSSSMSFNVTVTSGGNNNTVFANNSGITINDNAKATPYPSTIDVAGVNGTVRKVTVTLTGVTHAFPDDVDVLLVGPNGQGVVVMSDAGGGGPGATLNNAWLVFSDDATQSLPDNSPIQAFSLYKPTNYELNNSEFASPAPAGPYAATFTGAFDGINPNGTWSLYVQDDASPDAGSISGWVLNFDLNEVGPTITGLVDTNALEDTFVQIPFTIGGTADSNAVTFVTSYANSNLISAVKVGGNGTDRTLQITLLPNASGDSQITVQATDANGTRTRTFVLHVLPVNDAPVFAAVPPLKITGTTNLVLDVTDVDTSLNDLVFSAATAGVGLISDVQFTVTGSTVTAHIVPVSGATGTDALTISVSDGENVVRQTFNVTVVPVGPPVIEPIPDVTAGVNQPIVVPLTVTDPDTDINSLSFSAAPNGSGLLAGARFDITSSNTVLLTLTTVPDATGHDIVTVSASDGQFVTRQSFGLTITNVDQAPILGSIPDQTTVEDVSVNIPLTVSDRETGVSNLVFTAVSSNTNLVRTVSFSTIGNNVTAGVVLVTNAFGTANVTISVSDRTNAPVSQTFRLVVIEVPEPPILQPIANQTAGINTQVVVPLSVSDPDNALTDLSFSGAAATTNLVRNIQFSVTSSNAVALITLVPNATGSDQITIRVSDGETPVQQTFTLTVNNATRPTLTTALVGNNLSITVTGAAGATYVIQGASDVTGPYTQVGTVTIGSSGSADVQVPVTGAHRFFRAVAQ